MANGPGAAPRSGFVTALAWSFIALAAFGTFISLLQNVAVALLFLPEDLEAVTRAMERAENVPASARFMFENIRLLVAGFLLFSIVSLVAGIGLLRRRNWARLAIIGILGIGIAWHIAGLALSWDVFSSFAPMPGTVPDDIMESLDLMVQLIRWFTVVMIVVFSVLFAWIIRKLVSADIRREFLGP